MNSQPLVMYTGHRLSVNVSAIFGQRFKIRTFWAECHAIDKKIFPEQIIVWFKRPELPKVSHY